MVSVVHAKMHQQLVNGTGKVYDLPDLVRLLGDKITIEQPAGPDGVAG